MAWVAWAQLSRLRAWSLSLHNTTVRYQTGLLQQAELVKKKVAFRLFFFCCFLNPFTEILTARTAHERRPSEKIMAAYEFMYIKTYGFCSDVYFRYRERGGRPSTGSPGG